MLHRDAPRLPEFHGGGGGRDGVARVAGGMDPADVRRADLLRDFGVPAGGQIGLRDGARLVREGREEAGAHAAGPLSPLVHPFRRDGDSVHGFGQPPGGAAADVQHLPAGTAGVGVEPGPRLRRGFAVRAGQRPDVVRPRTVPAGPGGAGVHEDRVQPLLGGGVPLGGRDGVLPARLDAAFLLAAVRDGAEPARVPLLPAGAVPGAAPRSAGRDRAAARGAAGGVAGGVRRVRFPAAPRRGGLHDGENPALQGHQRARRGGGVGFVRFPARGRPPRPPSGGEGFLFRVRGPHGGHVHLDVRPLAAVADDAVARAGGGDFPAADCRPPGRVAGPGRRNEAVAATHVRLADGRALTKAWSQAMVRRWKER